MQEGRVLVNPLVVATGLLVTLFFVIACTSPPAPSTPVRGPADCGGDIACWRPHLSACTPAVLTRDVGPGASMREEIIGRNASLCVVRLAWATNPTPGLVGQGEECAIDTTYDDMDAVVAINQGHSVSCTGALAAPSALDQSRTAMDAPARGDIPSLHLAIIENDPYSLGASRCTDPTLAGNYCLSTALNVSFQGAPFRGVVLMRDFTGTLLQPVLITDQLPLLTNSVTQGAKTDEHGNPAPPVALGPARMTASVYTCHDIDTALQRSDCGNLDRANPSASPVTADDLSSVTPIATTTRTITINP